MVPPPDEVVQWLVTRNLELEAKYMDCLAQLRETADARLEKYLDHIGNTRRAAWCWSFECGRYFGDRGAEYARTQLVPLIPKRERDGLLHRDQVDILVMEDELVQLEN